MLQKKPTGGLYDPMIIPRVKQVRVGGLRKLVHQEPKWSLFLFLG